MSELARRNCRPCTRPHSGRGQRCSTGYRSVAGHAAAADHRPGQDHLRWPQLSRPRCRGGRPAAGAPAGLLAAGQHPGRTQSADGVSKDFGRFGLRGRARRGGCRGREAASLRSSARSGVVRREADRLGYGSLCARSRRRLRTAGATRWQGTYLLPPSYLERAGRDVALQLSRAGVRLAFVLNQTLSAKP